MRFNQIRIRQFHRALAPLTILPLLLTLTTGILFQFAVASDRADDFLWLLALHRGTFGSINLDMVYPFLNGLGLLFLVITGFSMWLQSPRMRRRLPSK